MNNEINKKERNVNYKKENDKKMGVQVVVLSFIYCYCYGNTLILQKNQKRKNKKYFKCLFDFEGIEEKSIEYNAKEWFKGQFQYDFKESENKGINKRNIHNCWLLQMLSIDLNSYCSNLKNYKNNKGGHFIRIDIEKYTKSFGYNYNDLVDKIR